MSFDPHQLDEIRARVSVSEIVGARFPLLKKGSEYVVKDNESFTINDKKKMWCEFGSGGDGKPHDVFDFLQVYHGLSFVDAVNELAKRAGVTLSNGSGRPAASANGHANGRDADDGYSRMREDGPSENGADRTHAGVARDQSIGKNEIVATWDIKTFENEVIYQVVRFQNRLPDGSWKLNKDGKAWKKPSHRRPSPDGSGCWLWALDVKDRETGELYEFMRYRDDWIKFDAKRFSDWKLTERTTFPAAENVEHWLYNANDVVDELQEPKEDQRTIFLPEGEPKVDVLREWGLLALSNTGGAKNFRPEHAEFLRGARHVVLLSDNDRAGTERVAKIAPMLKAVGVESVQALNFRDVWPKCPPKGDVKDWRDAGGGTKDALLEIVDGLKEWTPEPYKSKFGAKTAYDLGAPVRAYPWRIKGILPMHDNALLMGPSRSGKTFEALDMCMCIMQGKPFAGRKTVPCGIVYLAYEGATGFENRLRAYMKHNDLTPDDLHSFAWLTRPPNMYATEENAVALSDEILKLSESFRLPLGLIPLDTHNAATRGSSEIKSEDINKIVTNYDIVRTRTGANLMIVGHTNAAGDHRGSQLFFNGIETAVLIERVFTDAKHTIPKRDDEGRPIRRGKVVKQREDDDSTVWEFVLESVEIGTDEDGDPITSMVSVEPAQHVPDNVINEYQAGPKPDGFFLKGNNVDVFRALLKALENVGKPPPASLKLPSSIPMVITWAQLGMEYKKTDPQEHDEDGTKYRNRIKARTKRFREDLIKYNVIGIAEMIDPLHGTANQVYDTPIGHDPTIEKPKPIWYVWPTGRRVYGKGLQWPPVPKKKPEQKPLLAPGETADGLSKDIF